MSLTAAIGSLPTAIPATGHTHRHRHDFGNSLQRAAQAVAQGVGSGGQLLSNDLLQQISTLTGQAPAASAVTG